jgi:hypothetical protein
MKKACDLQIEPESDAGSCRHHIRKRKRHRQQTSHIMTMASSLSLVLIGLVSVATARVIQQTKCLDLIHRSNYKVDYKLTHSEYALVVAEMSEGTFDTDFYTLPGNIQETFNSLAFESTSASSIETADFINLAESSFLELICQDIETAILQALLSDADMPQPTVVLSRSPRIPPSPVLIEPRQVHRGLQQTSGASCDNTVSRTQCRVALFIADLSSDDLVNEAEYVRFVNRLSANKFLGAVFDDLPSNLIANFDKFATTGGQIGVTGSKLGQTPTSEQDVFIAALCCETDLAWQNSPSPTTPAPAPAANSPPPTFVPLRCKISMTASDFNRNDLLDKEDYVRFLNRLTQNEFLGVAFDDLYPRLQSNFAALAEPDDLGDPQINIFGTRSGQSASEDQAAFVDQICVDTAIALQPTVSPEPIPPRTLPPTGSPKETPATAPPTAPGPTPPPLPPGIAAVFSSFIISSPGISAVQLQQGANRAGLDRSYTLFANQGVVLINAVKAIENLEGRVLRKRKLEVTMVGQSADIYLLLDSVCPENAPPGSSCQTAFASFQVDTRGEDPRVISDDYTVASQTLIDNGALQAALMESDPQSILTILGSSFPVSSTFPPAAAPGTSAPSATPQAPPVGDRGSTDEDEYSTASLVAVGVGILCVIMLGVYFYQHGSFPGFRGCFKKKENKNDNDDDEGDVDSTNDDDDASDFGAKKPTAKNAFGADADPFGKPEQNSTPDLKNLFGFSGKNKDANAGFEEDNNAFGYSASGGAFGFEEDSTEEDSKESESESDSEDSGSVGENENAFGDAPKPSDWAASGVGGNENAFGDAPKSSDWAASGEGTDNNAFGSSASGGAFGFDEDSTEQASKESESEDESEDGGSVESESVSETENGGSVRGNEDAFGDAPKSSGWAASGEGADNFFDSDSPGGGWGAGQAASGESDDNFFSAGFSEEPKKSAAPESDLGSDEDSNTSFRESTFLSPMSSAGPSEESDDNFFAGVSEEPKKSAGFDSGSEEEPRSDFESVEDSNTSFRDSTFLTPRSSAGPSVSDDIFFSAGVSEEPKKLTGFDSGSEETPEFDYGSEEDSNESFRDSSFLTP